MNVLLCCSLLVCAQPATQINNELADPVADSIFIRDALRTADSYIDDDQYDSAQVWLNKIHEKISYRKPSMFSYFLTTRQAEVYYYNNLQQLGLQESKRAITIATALKDSILLADAYNFTGLFYTNMDKMDRAIPIFKKGIAVSKNPPYPNKYINLTRRYHLYGNISEAFEKINQHDSAIFYGRLSLSGAQQQNIIRGMSSAAMNLASSFLKKGAIDSAIVYFNLAKTTAHKNDDAYLELYCNGSLAICASRQQRKQDALQFIEEGFALMIRHPQLSSYYVLDFLDRAAIIFKQYGQFERLAHTFEQRSALQEVTHRKNNIQYQTILMTGVKNETRILNLEIAEARKDKVLATTRLYVVALAILLLIAGFIAYRYYALQRLRLAHVRNKISQDLHDEVGATLSGIALYSYIAKQQNQQQSNEQVAQSLDIIDKNAIDMVKKLSDIVWAVNPVHDNMEGLMSRLEEYAVEMASAKDIRVTVDKKEHIKQVKLSMEQRKNIYLILKEAINNAIKYSNCTHIFITSDLQNKQLSLYVTDDGQGFETQNAHKGNGLTNMSQRAHEMHARLEIKSKINEGASVSIICKITQ